MERTGRRAGEHSSATGGEPECSLRRHRLSSICLDVYLRSPRGYLEVDTQAVRKVVGPEHFSHVSVMGKRKMLTISEAAEEFAAFSQGIIDEHLRYVTVDEWRPSISPETNAPK